MKIRALAMLNRENKSKAISLIMDGNGNATILLKGKKKRF